MASSATGCKLQAGASHSGAKLITAAWHGCSHADHYIINDLHERRTKIHTRPDPRYQRQRRGSYPHLNTYRGGALAFGGELDLAILFLALLETS